MIHSFNVLGDLDLPSTTDQHLQRPSRGRIIVNLMHLAMGSLRKPH